MLELLLWLGKLAVLLLVYGFVLRVVGVLRSDLEASRPEAKLSLTRCPEDCSVSYNDGTQLPERTGVRLGQSLSLGRGAGNDIRLSDPFVSVRHCEIVWRDGSHWLADLGSRNRTFVNDRPATAPIRLNEGDRIVLGEVEFTYSRAD